ncbi:hypothetical protein BEYONPHE_77 [Bacillus phage Beyonphe]|nr:hypothetical protein BEYONPHE_77 [Bacillus phage Beyonphe]
MWYNRVKGRRKVLAIFLNKSKSHDVVVGSPHVKKRKPIGIVYYKI